MSENLVGGKYTAEMQCVIGTTKLTSQSTTVFASAAVHSESVTTYDPPMGGMSKQSDVIDEKFVEPCPAGMKPGTRSPTTERSATWASESKKPGRMRRPRRACRAPNFCLRVAQEVSLTQFDAVMAQDRVRDRAMEVEVWQHEPRQVA